MLLVISLEAMEDPIEGYRGLGRRAGRVLDRTVIVTLAKDLPGGWPRS
jgi:hypothetical protein